MNFRLLVAGTTDQLISINESRAICSSGNTAQALNVGERVESQGLNLGLLLSQDV